MAGGVRQRTIDYWFSGSIMDASGECGSAVACFQSRGEVSALAGLGKASELPTENLATTAEVSPLTDEDARSRAEEIRGSGTRRTMSFTDGCDLIASDETEEDDVEVDAAAYEIERQNRIRKNSLKLLSLGITPLQSAKDLKEKKPRRKARKLAPTQPSASAPKRRSARLQLTTATTVSTSLEISLPPQGPRVFARVGGLSEGADAWVETLAEGSFSPGNESVSIDPLRMNLRDTKLLKVYSMSTCRKIIAAGGKNGYVSVFRLDQTETSEEEDASFISSKLHTGWISEVKLVELDDGVKVALLTASNDGSISLWNPASVDVERKTPECLFTCVDMHTRGIFSFDVSNRRILTGSKDCTIGLARIESTGMTNISSFHDHHDGVVKCVRWRNPDEFASGGNDGRIILSDVRMKAPKAVTIESAQDGAVNSIDWSPTDCNYLISSGFDPSVHLWDVRNPKSYSLSFEGHTFKVSKKL